MGWEIGLIMGLALGGSLVQLAKARHVIRAAPEGDLLAELKRRRLERLLKEQAAKEVKQELEGN